MRTPTLALLPLLALLFVGTGCGDADTGNSGVTNDSALSETADSSARVSFSAQNWEPTWEGTPRAGGQLAIDYDFARLPQCRNTGRIISWVVEVSYRFDGGPVTTTALPGSPGTAQTLHTSGIAIPAGAHSLELWFENRAVGGISNCAAWDSRFGQNYSHDIAPAP